MMTASDHARLVGVMMSSDLSLEKHVDTSTVSRMISDKITHLILYEITHLILLSHTTVG